MSEEQGTLERRVGVDRCVCFGVSFEELRRLARAYGLDFDGLSRMTGCSTGCSLCGPYVKLMLRTGETEFPVMQPGAIEEMMVVGRGGME